MLFLSLSFGGSDDNATDSADVLQEQPIVEETVEVSVESESTDQSAPNESGIVVDAISIFLDEQEDVQPPAPTQTETAAVFAARLALGHNHTCYLEGGEVFCWGSDYYGQTTVPAGLIDVNEISAADQNTCVLTPETMSCWGIDGWFTVPVSNGRSLSVGGFHVCFVEDEGVWCSRGGNQYGELEIPVDIHQPIQVAAGVTHTCALDANGVKCWGSNEFGETDVPPLDNPTQISAGGWFSCALDGAQVVCWGNNEFGQLELPSLVEPKAVIAGHNHACAIDRYGLQCWGRNAFDQAIVPSELAEVALVQPGTHHSCAVDASNDVYCWGFNGQGQTSVPSRATGSAGD